MPKATPPRTKGTAKKTKRPAALRQDPHGVPEGERALEAAIGREVRRLRERAGLTLQDLSGAASLSQGMLSKIENGGTSPSLATIQALSKALNVPVTALFRGVEEIRDATFVKAGEGLKIERRGTRAGHQYELLGHSPHGDVVVEPYLITLTAESDVFPSFQHPGFEFIYMIKGELVYRHGSATYTLTPGDALSFESDVPHGPYDLKKLPIEFLSIITYARDV